MLLNIPCRRIELFLIVALIFFAAVGMAMEATYYLTEHKRLLGFLRQFTLAEEANVPTWYSTMLLASCAVSLGVIAFMQPSGAGHYRRHWQILALIFLYMSLDESAIIHEMTIRPFREAFDLGGILYFSWVVPAFVLMAVFLACYLGFLRYLPSSSRNRFVLAGCVYVAGAFGTELVIGYWWDMHGDNFINGILNVTQETMEIAGSSLFLSALLRHLAAAGRELRVGFSL